MFKTQASYQQFWTAHGAIDGIMQLNNGMVLYLKEVSNYLALVCLLRSNNFENQGLMDYNVGCFKESIAEVFSRKSKRAALE